MRTPAISPAKIAKYMGHLSFPSTNQTSGKDAIAITIAEKFVPLESAPRSCFWVAPSFVFTALFYHIRFNLSIPIDKLKTMLYYCISTTIQRTVISWRGILIITPLYHFKLQIL